MHLSEYMSWKKLSDEQVAEGIRRSRVTVSRIRRKRVRPDWATIREIEIFSQGAVTANDFVDLAQSAGAAE